MLELFCAYGLSIIKAPSHLVASILRCCRPVSSVAPTPDSDAPTAPPVSPRRPWQRLHASTWVVACVVLAVFVILAVPAYTQFNRTQRGWPLIAVEQRRAATGLTAATPLNSPLEYWSDPDWPEWLIWSWWVHADECLEYSLRAAAADVLVGFASVAVGIVAFESWRRRRRRVSQIHLVDLAAVTVLVAFAAAWLGAWMRGHDAEQALVKRLDDFEREGDFLSTSTSYVGPAWFRRLFGAGLCNPFERVTELYCFDPSAAAADWLTQNVPLFTSLTRFHGCGESFTDAMLAALSSQSGLTDVHLWSCPVTDNGIDYLSNLSQLGSVDLSFTQVSNAGLRKLAALRSLYYLDVSNTLVTPDGVSAAKKARPDLDIIWSEP